MASLKIYFPSAGATYIDCWATRFDETDYAIILETFITSSQRNTLFSHIVPGIYRELYNVLGKPKFVDGTFQKRNTVYLECQSGYGLSGVRQSRECTVKSASDYFINQDFFGCKLELVRIDV